MGPSAPEVAYLVLNLGYGGVKVLETVVLQASNPRRSNKSLTVRAQKGQRVNKSRT